jgi:hypothetical protein
LTIDSWIAATLLKIDPTPFFQKYGENAWARVKGYLDACTDAAAAPVIEKYRDVLAVADVFTASTTFWVMESNRLDWLCLVHPPIEEGTQWQPPLLFPPRFVIGLVARGEGARCCLWRTSET